MTEVAREATTLSDTYNICYICYLLFGRTQTRTARGLTAHGPRPLGPNSNVINLDTLSFAIVYV